MFLFEILIPNHELFVSRTTRSINDMTSLELVHPNQNLCTISAASSVGPLSSEMTAHNWAELYETVFAFETLITETFLEMIFTGARAPSRVHALSRRLPVRALRDLSLFVFTLRVISLSAAAPDVSRSGSACSSAT